MPGVGACRDVGAEQPIKEIELSKEDTVKTLNNSTSLLLSHCITTIFTIVVNFISQIMLRRLRKCNKTLLSGNVWFQHW